MSFFSRYQKPIKYIASIIATTIIVSGTIYAVNITSLSQTATTGDVLTSTWVNAVNTSVGAAGGAGTDFCYYSTSTTPLLGYTRSPGTYYSASGGTAHNIFCRISSESMKFIYSWYNGLHHPCDITTMTKNALCMRTLDFNQSTDENCVGVQPTASCTIGDKVGNTQGSFSDVFGNIIYAGTYNGFKYYTTPSNCTNSTTPFCDGQSDDVYIKKWSTESVLRNVVSTTDGAANTATLAAFGAAYPAAKYCADMDYAGYTDWFLPATSEFALLNTNNVAIGGFTTNMEYWTSTEGVANTANRYQISAGLSTTLKSYDRAVRCVRKV